MRKQEDIFANKEFNEIPLTASTRANSKAFIFNPVHKIIEKYALENPHSVAVRFRDYEMSYEDFNKAANRLAHHLKGLQIGLESHVMVCMDPSSSSLIALLSILKLGAVYIPLEPSYPAARITSIINQIKPRAILIDESTSHIDFGGYNLVRLNELPESLPESNLMEMHSSDQTAYIFHTSGSTGTPKAVMASQSNLSYYIQVAKEMYGMNAYTIMPTLARFSFSISLFELLGPLCAGGIVWVLDRNHVLDPQQLAVTLSKSTMFHAGPSLLKGLIAYITANYLDFSPFAAVRHASSGGDMIPPELLEKLKTIFSNADIFVIYGSTEIACMGCTYAVPREYTITKTYVGTAFPNTTVHLLNDNLEPVARGTEGEVWFAGEGVGQGYLNQPELTKERFHILDGLRTYRTGDIGRFNENGELELLGRTDFQIKIRGMRVELTEVEYMLRQAPGVREAVVSTKDLGAGDQSLIAFIVLDNPSQKDLNAINSHLANQLPEYMLPVAYAFLEQLPLNHNLKLDRKALLEATNLELHRLTDGPIRIPVTHTEKRMAKLWCSLLDIKEVGLDSHFFDIGGHSLLAVELLLKIKSEFGLTIDGMHILRETLEVIAQFIDQQLGHQTQSKCLTSIEEEPSFSVETFYFKADSSLYGILYKPKATVQKTVLICGPCPHELELSLFVIQQLARRLAAKGIAVLQFHYYGTMDSAGEGPISSLSRWQEDICAAHKQLTEHYPSTPVIGIGIRLGATLLWAEKDNLPFKGLIFWDPVFDGGRYLKELNASHFKKLSDILYYRNINLAKNSSGQRELLGTTYTDFALMQLQNLKIIPSFGRDEKITWIATQIIDPHFLISQSIQAKQAGWTVQKIPLNITLDWLKKLPDTGISKILAYAVEKL